MTSPTSEKPIDPTRTINWVGISCFIVLTFGISWTIWSGSIWPGVLAHAVGNQAAGLALLALVTLGNSYLGASSGLVSIILSAAFAIWLIATGRLKPESSQAVEMKHVPT